MWVIYTKLLLTAGVFCIIHPAFGWSALGHKVVAEIAWRELDQPARQQIVDVLRRHPHSLSGFLQCLEADRRHQIVRRLSRALQGL